MPGSFTFTPPENGVPLGRPSADIAVYRYNPDSETDDPLPNIRCVEIQQREGAEPWSARFRYAFGDPLGSDEEPWRFEEVYPLDATGPFVVQNDDRILVSLLNDDGTEELLFDGFAQIPQADLGPETESVTFTALGTPIREWDTPLEGALMRDADDTAAVSDIQTDNPARFNPDGKPNATPKSQDSGDGANVYPVFLGPIYPANKINGSTIRPWTLEMAARYICNQGNPDEKYTSFDPGQLAQLVAWEPDDGSDTGAIGEAPTTEDIIVQDYDITGEVWPAALHRLIEPYGFGMRFNLEQDDEEKPTWSLDVYRKDDQTRIKELYLQQAENTLDPGQTNVGQMSLARDIHDLANAIVIDAKPNLIEASFVLVPGFKIAATDADAGNLTKWVGENAPDTYRMWIFDECTEGWWDVASNSWITSIGGDFAKLLTQGAKDRQFVKRRRPGKAKLVSVDADNKPLRAQLHVAKTYGGTMPGVWDTTGTWQEVNSDDWQLLDDRLGFKVTCEDPNHFSIGKPSNGSTKVFGSNVLKLVKSMASPDAANPTPIFRLTCVIDADKDLGVEAPSRSVSPTSFTIMRRSDCRDRFKKTIVSKYSALAKAANLGVKDTTGEDDTQEAQDYAAAMRRSRETGVFAGSVTIPRITTAYSVGDKIDEIDGRGVSLQSNINEGSGEAPIYPVVVGITWSFDGHLATTLELSDRRAEPPPRHRSSHLD